MKYSNLIFYCIFLFSSSVLNAQDSLLRADLSKFVYHFDLKDQQMIGPGADLLVNEARINQYFLIGEYHGSPLISKFTEAILPILKQSGYDYFGLEVGPESVKILREMSAESDKVRSRLNSFNNKYNVNEDGDVYSAIPFFDNIEDAEFLAAAAQNKINLIGIDQEFCYGYLPLVDRIYDQLNQKEQSKIKPIYTQLRDSISQYYEWEATGKKDLIISIKNSKVLASFLQQASRANNKNKAIADAITKTTEIYYYNITRKYLKCNSSRIDYMKLNLKRQFDEFNFDLNKDKMVLKMGAIHTARGLSRLSLYELGNMLSELADYHGNSSVNLQFSDRYFMENDTLVDGLADPKSYYNNFYDLLQFGKKDQWTVIDLRPLRQRMFYARRYKINPKAAKVFHQHDLYIIPPVDYVGKPNYDVKIKK